MKVNSDPLASINAEDFGRAGLRGKQDQDALSLLFQTHSLAQRNPGPTLSKKKEKKRKRLRQGLLEPLLGPPFLSYRLDVRSTFTFVFSSRSMQDSLHRRSLCVSMHASETECLRTSVLPLYSRQSAGFCPGPWSATSAGQDLSLEGKPFPNRPAVTYGYRAGQDPGTPSTVHYPSCSSQTDFKSNI